MRNLIFTSLATLIFCSFIFTSCKKNEVVSSEVLSIEKITTLNLTFYNLNTNETTTFSFKELDGSGGLAPEIDPIVLDANTTYSLTISLFKSDDIRATPIQEYEFTPQIEATSEAYQFFFNPENLFNNENLFSNFAYADQDVNNKPLGLANTVTTGNANRGTLTITLRNQPDKNAPNVSMGDMTNAGGETDIEATFTTIIE